MTDRELIGELAKAAASDARDCGLTFAAGEEFVEVDGIKIAPFSLDQNLRAGVFDAGGNLVANSEDDEEDLTSEEDGGDNGEKAKRAIERIIELAGAAKTVRAAIHNCRKDVAKLNALTDVATELMFLGRDDIYAVTIDELREEIARG
jgi:hypothetical protein